MNTACSAGIESGTTCRLHSGRVRNSRKAPGCLTIPSTERLGQWRPRLRRHQSHFAHTHTTLLQMNRAHRSSSITDRYNGRSMPAELLCIGEKCRTRFPIDAILYNCPQCGGLLEAVYPGILLDPGKLKSTWRTRR